MIAIIATLQLVNEICNVAFFWSDEAMAGLTWSNFVSQVSGQPALVEYLKERRLYVSEPVTAGEEI